MNNNGYSMKNKIITVEDIFDLCYSRWEIEVDIKPNIKESGGKYKGCMAETPWYLLNKPVESWWFGDHDRQIEIIVDEK